MNRKQRRRDKSLQENLFPIDEFSKAFNLHKNGKVHEAKSIYIKILNKNPNHFDTLRHLGIANQDLYLLDDALVCFRNAQKINPANSQIYNNLGSIMFQTYRLIDAKKLYEKSLSINYNYMPALNNLALVCYRLRYAHRALIISKKALELQKDNILAKTNHALALSINNKLDEAINIFKEIIKEKPTGANYKNLGTAFRDSGEVEKSFEYFSKAHKEDPNDEAIFFSLAASKLYIPDQLTLDNYENILNSDKLLDYNQKISIAFALYNSHKKLNDYETAGKFLLLGNKYSNTWIKSDIKKEEVFINNLKMLFTKKFINEKSSMNTLQVVKVNPIFIVGMPRSGTTLCEQIVASHSQVTGGGELPHLIRISGIESAYNLDIEIIENFNKTINELNQLSLEKKAIVYLNEIKKISNGNKYVTDKMPHNFILIGFIKIIFPNAKIIYCKRNPMDNCFSLYAHKFVDMSHGYSYNQEILGKYYNFHSDLMDYWFSIFGNEIFLLDHEKLIENQEKVSKELIDYCGLKWENSCLEFYKTKRQIQTASNEQVREPINKKSIAAWKKYEKILDPLKLSLE